MRQYTIPEQTAKLNELGFEPKQVPATCGWADDEEYYIGELIEMLPKHIFPNGECLDLHIYTNQNLWVVKYVAVFYKTSYRFRSKELTDALYDMIVKLKEEGVI